MLVTHRTIFLKDLRRRYRRLYALEKQVHTLSDGMEDTPDAQRLLEEFARV